MALGDLRQPDDGRARRAYVVRHAGKELRLRLAGVASRLERCLEVLLEPVALGVAALERNQEDGEHGQHARHEHGGIQRGFRTGLDRQLEQGAERLVRAPDDLGIACEHRPDQRVHLLADQTLHLGVGGGRIAALVDELPLLGFQRFIVGRERGRLLGGRPALAGNGGQRIRYRLVDARVLVLDGIHGLRRPHVHESVRQSAQLHQVGFHLACGHGHRVGMRVYLIDAAGDGAHVHHRHRIEHDQQRNKDERHCERKHAGVERPREPIEAEHPMAAEIMRHTTTSDLLSPTSAPHGVRAPRAYPSAQPRRSTWAPSTWARGRILTRKGTPASLVRAGAMIAVRIGPWGRRPPRQRHRSCRAA